MPADRILVVEDDPAIRVGLEEKLGMEGYRVRCAKDGHEAVRLLEDHAHDLVVLDLMLPGRDGLSVLRWLRERDGETPVLILSAKGQEPDKIAGLRTGADDYLAKPFGLGELLARIAALLRRARGATQTMRLGDLRIELGEREVYRDDERVALRPKELDILLFLARHVGHTVSREQILAGVWGHAPASAERTVDYHVLNLRRKIEDDPRHPKHVLTRHGLGFELR